jgi:hypothetical protein
VSLDVYVVWFDQKLPFHDHVYHCYIHATSFMKVLHSQRINEPTLKRCIILKYNDNIESAHCDCVAGLVCLVCSHVASILFLLENWTV